MKHNEFGCYIKAELEAIEKYRQAESKRIGKTLTYNEAVLSWIEHGNAERFRQQYEERNKHGPNVC